MKADHPSALNSPWVQMHGNARLTFRQHTKHIIIEEEERKDEVMDQIS